MTHPRIEFTCPRCNSRCTAATIPGWVRCVLCNFEAPKGRSFEGDEAMKADRVLINISEIRFTAAQAKDMKTGFLGYIDCTLNDSLRLSAIQLRRTRAGRLVLSYPARRDGNRMDQFYYRPITDDARLELEHQVITALGHLEGAG